MSGVLAPPAARPAAVPPAQPRCATRRLGLRTAGVITGGVLVVFLASHDVPRPGPAPERARVLLAATCTAPGAAPYRGVAPSVRLPEPGRYLVTAEPPAPSPVLTVRYERRRGFGSAVDTLRPATRADRELLAELGCAPGWCGAPCRPSDTDRSSRRLSNSQTFTSRSTG